MRIALYARSSTRGQKLAAQLEALRDYATRRGGHAQEFVDRGVSGAHDRRPALDRLMAAVRRREVDAVAITKLDRMARSVRHLTDVAAELEAVGVSLVVIDQAIDTGTPAGRLLFNVLGSIAEFERDLIRERVSAGLKAAKRRGQQLGRPPALDARGIARARRLRASGHSVRAVAEKLGVGSSTVQRMTRGVAG
jgi:DNA invertase Pin-like site-specific DNA recombinase